MQHNSKADEVIECKILGGRKMTVLKAEDMHCEKCVERINKALDAAGITHEVNLAEKTVSIDGCEHCVKTAIETLDDLGFEAVVVE